MDYEFDKINKQRSILQQNNELFSSKILTRQSTLGSCSSRFFFGASDGVPFQWETQPGKPIKPPSDDILPPLSPPPAVLAMNLPMPCMDILDEPKARKWSRAWLAKKIKTTLASHHKILGHPRKMLFSTGLQQEEEERRRQQQQQELESERYDHSVSARYSISSFKSTSTSTSSSTNSFRDEKTSRNVHSKALLQGRPFNCNPRGLSDIVVYFVKRG